MVRKLLYKVGLVKDPRTRQELIEELALAATTIDALEAQVIRSNKKARRKSTKKQ